jgi:putative membrane protein
MRGPTAYPTRPEAAPPPAPRPPRAFEAETVTPEAPQFEAEQDSEIVALPPRRRFGWLARIALATAGALVSIAIWLWIDQLVRDLFARYEWLGWAGVALALAFLIAVVTLAIREIWSVRRLRRLDHIRERAAATLESDKRSEGLAVARELHAVYAHRADLATARRDVDGHLGQIFDGAEMVRFAERTLMRSLDSRARALTAASARRVALVTTVSPRALIDVAFVLYESARLAGAIATLYGARPGFFGFLKLVGAVLSHLAVTGGLMLTDGLVEQLVGQGLAARLSARLGEGVVNGLMTVRVGIAAMRVVRPLPYDTLPQPVVRDFLPELVNLTRNQS